MSRAEYRRIIAAHEFVGRSWTHAEMASHLRAQAEGRAADVAAGYRAAAEELEQSPLRTRLTNVEDGYAVVRKLDGTRIGAVSREKWGSSRTGTRWIATEGTRGGLTIGTELTRAEAVEMLALRRREVEAHRVGMSARGRVARAAVAA